MIDSIVKNLDFEKIKEKFRPLGIATICFVAVFTAGFGVGKNYGSGGVVNPPSLRSDNTNYNTNAATETKSKEPEPSADKSPEKSSDKAIPNSATLGECNIKGSKSKTYHMPGGSFYDRTSAAQCFETEEEAVAAGYKKSSR